MAVRITHVRLSQNGSRVEHITDLAWSEVPSNKTGSSSRAQMVEFVEGGGVAFTQDGAGSRANLVVVTPMSGPKYVRTRSDNTVADNLLHLPRF